MIESIGSDVRRPSDVRRASDVSVVCRPTGGLDWTGAVALRHYLHGVLRPGMDLHIDLGDLDFVDAVGISALVGSVRRVRALGGRAQIRNPRPEVRRRLQILGVYDLLGDASQTGRDSRLNSDDAA